MKRTNFSRRLFVENPLVMEMNRLTGHESTVERWCLSKTKARVCIGDMPILYAVSRSFGIHADCTVSRPRAYMHSICSSIKVGPSVVSIVLSLSIS